MTLLANDATSTERVEIIRSLIDTVTFDPAPALDLRLELVGDFAQVVHLAQNPTGNGAVTEECARSIKVVAGRI